MPCWVFFPWRPNRWSDGSQWSPTTWSADEEWLSSTSFLTATSTVRTFIRGSIFKRDKNIYSIDKECGKQLLAAQFDYQIYPLREPNFNFGGSLRWQPGFNRARAATVCFWPGHGPSVIFVCSLHIVPSGHPSNYSLTFNTLRLNIFTLYVIDTIIIFVGL